MLRQALFRLSQQKQLRTIATHNPVAQNMARRFVAGETLGEAIGVVAQINQTGMSATLDHLGENVRTREEAIESARAACAIMQSISDSGVKCNASLKLTQLGLDISPKLALDNLERVVAKAAELDNFIRIDMEGSEYVDRTLDTFFQIFDRYVNVGVVIQSYLYRSASDLEQLLKAGARVRLVKGAYLEPSSVAFQRKSDVDANFLRLTAMLLTAGNYPAIATHDMAMIDATRQWAADHAIGRERFEFQMLYGVRRDLQGELVHDGYNVRIYVPFGTSWYPYFMRRLAERPANVMFVLQNIARESQGSGR